MKFKLSNCLVYGSERISNYPSLLYRTLSGRSNVDDVTNSLVIRGGEVDFTTYFNSLPTVKWLKYTNAEKFYLHIEYCGSSFVLNERVANCYDWESRELSEYSRAIDAANGWSSLDLELHPEGGEILHGFSISSEGAVNIRNIYYYTEIDEGLVRHVELALATTTFRKESYIKRNLELIRKGVFDSQENVAEHFNVHVIDNGRTLDCVDLQSEHIRIHPNPNVGGSGGFAYGMMIATEQIPEATHVLLMDDDVEVLPESFIRTYNVLSLAKDEYSEAFLSGAMMSLEEPNLRTEDLGFFTFSGNFSPLKPAGFMTNLHDAVETEAYEAPVNEYGDTTQQYAGWWYCVIPTSTIKRFGLPLPLFVRADDAEYSLRCQPKFMTMNGICVWHNEFRFKYSAAVERYQVSRNTLICQATTGIAPQSDFLREIHHEVQLDLKKFNYADAMLAVKGLEDFLRGPEFIASPVAESRFMEANREKEKLVPIEDVRAELDELGVDLDRLSYWNLNNDGLRSRFEAAKDFVTFNGQRLVNEENKRLGKVAVIDAAGWVYPAYSIRNAGTIVVVDMPNRKCAIRHYNKDKFNEVWSRYKSAAKEFRKNKKALYEAYASYRDKFTSYNFWKDYLKKAAE